MPDLNELTVPQLKEEAKVRGLDIPSDAKKADIVAMLESAAKVSGVAPTDLEPIPSPPPLEPGEIESAPGGLVKSDKRAWWCPRCDHSHPWSFTKCVRCGWVRT